MKDEKLKELLEYLISCHKGEYNRHIMGMISYEEYEDSKEDMLEYTINQIKNLSVISEISKLKEGLK